MIEQTLRILLLLLIMIVASAYAYKQTPVFALISVVIVTMLIIWRQRPR